MSLCKEAIFEGFKKHRGFGLNGYHSCKRMTDSPLTLHPFSWTAQSSMFRKQKMGSTFVLPLGLC